MKRVFVDTSYYLSILSPNDPQHRAALEWPRTFRGQYITTTWVLAEVLNSCARGPARRHARTLISGIHANASAFVVPASQRWFDLGYRLFCERMDKDWSITDCISFLVMRQLRIEEVPSPDHHFTQAGFKMVLT